MENELVTYIIDAQKHGMSEFEIKQNLLNAGWEAQVVEQSFGFAKAAENKPQPTRDDELKQVSRDFEASLKPITQKASVFTPALMSQSPQITSAVTDASLKQTSSKFGKTAKIILMAVVALLILGAGGYAAYAYVYNNPTKTWQKFLQTSQDKIYQSDISFKYSDPNTLNASSIPFSLQNIKFGFDGNFYANYADKSNPQSDTNVQYTFSSGSTSFSTGFQYILLDNTLYVNVGDNPLLSSIGVSMGSGQKVKWLKFDLKEIESTASSSVDSAQAEKLKNVFNQDFITQLQKIWADANVIKIKKYIGREKINNVSVAHFQNELDQKALKTAFNQTATKFIQALKDAGATVSDSDSDNINFAINATLDKLQVQNIETWVGAGDYKLYKISVTSNAPSIISTIQNLVDASQNNFNPAMPKSRDAKRLADMRQMASALELYYNDNGGYPAADNNGTPAGGMAPKYIGQIPTAPSPADGTCTDYFNTYWYKPTGNKTVQSGKTVYSSYTYTFCLGNQTGSYQAGIAELAPTGIRDKIVCPSSDQSLCSKTASPEADQSVHQLIQKFIDGLKFNATITINSTYHDYGKIKQLTPPADALDVLQAYKKSQN